MAARDTAPVDASQYGSVAAAAAVAFGSRRPLYFPTGTYRHTGPPLDPGGAFTLIGDPGATVRIPDGGYLIETGSLIPATRVTGLRFLGGAGAIRYTRTGPNVAGTHVFDGVEFRDYTGCAVSANSSDMPYWRFRDCQFTARSYDDTIGVALPDRAAGSVIDSCDFLRNRIDVKVRDGGPNVHLLNCGFIRLAGQPQQARARVWIVPSGQPTAGAGMQISGCKFGPENMTAGDLQIVYADEAAGSDNGSQLPELDTPSQGSVSQHFYTQNSIGLGWARSGSGPVIFSTAGKVGQLVIEPNAYPGMAPTALVEFLAAVGKPSVAVPRARCTVA